VQYVCTHMVAVVRTRRGGRRPGIAPERRRELAGLATVGLTVWRDPATRNPAGQQMPRDSCRGAAAAYQARGREEVSPRAGQIGPCARNQHSP